MRVKYHVASSCIIGSIVYICTDSYMNFIASFLAGVLIDADHFIDYYLNYGFTHRFKTIYNTMAAFEISKVYFFFHAFDLLCAFWLIIFLVPLNNVWFAIAIGLTQHMFLDLIANSITPKGYFLAYRLMNHFRKECVLRSH